MNEGTSPSPSAGRTERSRPTTPASQSDTTPTPEAEATTLDRRQTATRDRAIYDAWGAYND